MRLVAALILALIAAEALAQIPHSVIYYGDEQGFVDDTADRVGFAGDTVKSSYSTCSECGVGYDADFLVEGGTFLGQPVEPRYRDPSRISVTTDLPDMDLNCDE